MSSNGFSSIHASIQDMNTTLQAIQAKQIAFRESIIKCFGEMSGTLKSIDGRLPDQSSTLRLTTAPDGFQDIRHLLLGEPVIPPQYHDPRRECRQSFVPQSMSDSDPRVIGQLYALGERLCASSDSYLEDETTATLLAGMESSLRDRVLANEIRVGPSGATRPFFPHGSIEALITPAEVIREITDGRHLLGMMLTDEQIQDYGCRVCEEDLSLQKVFAVLVILERPWEIVYFVNEDISDKDLPIKDYMSTNFEGGDTTLCFKLQHPRNEQELCSMASFSRVDFERIQWQMMPASFLLGVQSYRFHGRQSMPWLEEWYFNEQYTSYAYISRIRMHKDHHSFDHPFVRLQGCRIIFRPANTSVSCSMISSLSRHTLHIEIHSLPATVARGLVCSSIAEIARSPNDGR